MALIGRGAPCRVSKRVGGRLVVMFRPNFRKSP